MMKSLWASVQENPVVFRKINGWLTVIWFLAAFPICFFLANSVPFLVFISVYAVVTGHLSTWQASRVEVRQEQEKEERDSKDEADLVKVEKKVDELHDQAKK
jgi:hypothetical protein